MVLVVLVCCANEARRRRVKIPTSLEHAKGHTYLSLQSADSISSPLDRCIIIELLRFVTQTNTHWPPSSIV